MTIATLVFYLPFANGIQVNNDLIALHQQKNNVDNKYDELLMSSFLQPSNNNRKKSTASPADDDGQPQKVKLVITRLIDFMSSNLKTKIQF